MKDIYAFCFLLMISSSAFSQVQSDLTKSVPVWLEFDPTSNQSVLRWISDPLASQYEISEFEYGPTITTNLIGDVDGTINEYAVGILTPGQLYGFQLDKTTPGEVPGMGLIYSGIEIPAIHDRGRCLIAIDDTLAVPLQIEIDQLILDLTMDGWFVDTINVSRSLGVVDVKALIQAWYNDDYTNSQALLILGRVAVPYSGNSAYDGHTNHQGAWSADTYYAEMDGNWTDSFVNNTTPSRDQNKNIPGDGKFDQTAIPGLVEIEVGRVDFHNLPAFTDDEIELTRNYLNKNHEFRIGNKDIPRRAIIENNFASFDEGFGQSGWRSFVPMFGADNVSSGNYDVVLDTAAYLCSYACGPGSYSSAGGIGNTANLWASKDIQTVFTMNFGSYFGDWDSQNNFLRSALASGDVLTNAWAGRPVWHLYRMALGKHIGFCAMESQNAMSFNYNQGFGAHSTHVALMGDPTLRLHPMKPAANLLLTFTDGDMHLSWEASIEAENGYFVYRKTNDGDWEILSEFLQQTTFVDPCIQPFTDYTYMVKATRLENTGSGSYYNTSLGIAASMSILENPAMLPYYADADLDGFGNPNTELFSCDIPPGFVDNNLDCDDENNDINPDGIEIPNNGIDEDCEDGDLITNLADISKIEIAIYPNPTSGLLKIDVERLEGLTYNFFDAYGRLIRSENLQPQLNVSDFDNGIYWLEITDQQSLKSVNKKIIILK
ncbi:T9SS type A sorting domain-containing protein [Lewinella cohaerens]|uniref:T9SS type A sorting domain-containing protein n=1 Tax=Lewinella cohaerens TaxID=70995 RepID=UPI0003826974|nr:T9SS type A sorting domain-containing protein [Lewinella cohaerens]